MVNNLQELIEQTAYTGNVQARINVDATQMRIIEQAIEGLTEIRFKYKSQISKTATQKQEKPIGLLYGRFGYLVCLGYRDKPIIYRLDLLEEVTSTTQFFVKPEKFNFKEWCNDSFGIYHGDDRIRVVVEFDPVVSRRAEKIKFHASQQVSRKKDGSVQMVFICKGWKELIYEFMHPDWLGHIKIKEPKELKDAVKDYLKVCKDMI
jgi:predicted DNA-binding transcriptional regulator YafY